MTFINNNLKFQNAKLKIGIKPVCIYLQIYNKLKTILSYIIRANKVNKE